ncbi:MAG TPA: hypothetical protein VIY27_02635, partial [Myxococcota bacterium]
LFDTLAAAYASAGRFAEAERAESDALREAEARGERAKLPGFRERLALYRAKRPFVEGKTPPAQMGATDESTSP